MTESDTAIIRYVDAAEGERYWRINRVGLVLSRKAMDRHAWTHPDTDDLLEVDKVAYRWVACQWPSRNMIYRTGGLWSRGW